MPAETDVLSALSHVQDPDLHKDIVSLGFVKDVRISGGDVGPRHAAPSYAGV